MTADQMPTRQAKARTSHKICAKCERLNASKGFRFCSKCIAEIRKAMKADRYLTPDPFDGRTLYRHNTRFATRLED